VTRLDIHHVDLPTLDCSIKLPHRGKREVHRIKRATLSAILKSMN